MTEEQKNLLTEEESDTLEGLRQGLIEDFYPLLHSFETILSQLRTNDPYQDFEFSTTIKGERFYGGYSASYELTISIEEEAK